MVPKRVVCQLKCVYQCVFLPWNSLYKPLIRDILSQGLGPTLDIDHDRDQHKDPKL